MDVLAGTGATFRIEFEDETGITVPDDGSVTLVLLDITGQPYTTVLGAPFKFPLVDQTGTTVVQGSASAPSLSDLGVSAGIQLPDGIQEIPIYDTAGNLVYKAYGPASGQPS